MTRNTAFCHALLAKKAHNLANCCLLQIKFECKLQIYVNDNNC